MFFTRKTYNCILSKARINSIVDDLCESAILSYNEIENNSWAFSLNSEFTVSKAR